MPLQIKVSIPESIRRAKAADPSLSDDQLSARFGVRPQEVRNALRYKQPGGRKPGRQRA